MKIFQATLWNLAREAKFKVQLRVKSKEDEKTERGGLSEVDDPTQRGASDWSRSQGRLGNLADGQVVHFC